LVWTLSTLGQTTLGQNERSRAKADQKRGCGQTFDPLGRSSGPNASFGEDGFDEDDIYSDMPDSPLRPMYTRKKFEANLAILVGTMTWLLLTIVYLLPRN